MFANGVIKHSSPNGVKLSPNASDNVYNSTKVLSLLAHVQILFDLIVFFSVNDEVVEVTTAVFTAFASLM